MTEGTPSTSGMSDIVAHLILVVPGIIGLIWTIIQWVQVKGIKVDGSRLSDDSSDSDESASDAVFLDRETRKGLVGKMDLSDNERRALMVELEDIIANGAKTFLFTEYLAMAVYVVVFSGIIIGFYLACGKPAAVAGATTIAFVVGSVTSVLSGYIGMSAAVMANSRTTFKCWEDNKDAGEGDEGHCLSGLRVALCGGSIMGFGLCSLGVLVMYVLILVYRATFFSNLEDHDDTKDLCESLAGFGLGGSSIALFGRVGGGIYTKAADVGADLSGKNAYGLNEDDPRNPACIADNVGDNVGDIAGMGADLFGSFAESTVAALVIASQSTLNTTFASLYFPLMISSSGIIVGIVTLAIILCLLPRIAHNYDGIETSLKLLLIVSTFLQTPVVILLGYMALPPTITMPGCIEAVTPAHCVISICLGLWSGLIIGLVTEYYTSHSYSPVREIAESQMQTAATGIIYGLALGYASCVIPVILIAMIIVVNFSICGMYGVALGALGMLSTLTIGLTIDGYGPIADNAGGIAEMSACGEKVRECTDALDAAGNTTAAIGKGFAIGSAALVSLALFGAFKQRANIQHVDAADAWTFGGLLVGALLPYAFSALTMKSVGKAANEMVAECMRQFDLMFNGPEEDRQKNADYQVCIEICTRSSLKEMILPGLLVILSPLLTGIVFGKNCAAGLLVGALVSGVQLAISMSNTGGAWDNAKKYIKSDPFDPDVCKKGAPGVPGEKWDAAHKNSVTGDTVGDPLKDTSGPSLNILVKLSAITSLVFAAIVSEKFSDPTTGGPIWLKHAKLCGLSR